MEKVAHGQLVPENKGLDCFLFSTQLVLGEMIVFSAILCRRHISSDPYQVFVTKRRLKLEAPALSGVPMTLSQVPR